MFGIGFLDSKSGFYYRDTQRKYLNFLTNKLGDLLEYV